MASATNVTVLGAGGSTVTIPFTSAANAAAAQSALNVINLAVQVGLMNQQNATGAASITSPTSPYALTGAVATGAVTVTGTTGLLPFGAIDAVSNSTGPVTFIGQKNVITVAGGGQTTFLNQSVGAKVFLSNGSNQFIEAAGAAAQVNIDSNKNLIWDFGAGGSTTVNGYGDSIGTSALIARGYVDSLLGATGGGSVLYQAQTGLNTISQATYNPSATVPALTITGAAGADIQYYAGTNTNAFINPTSGNVTVVGTVSGGGGGGSVTLFGGGAQLGKQAYSVPAFSGSATVFGGHGYFAGGTAGNNLLQTDTTASATTLLGGGSGDQLFNYGAKNTLIAGAGAETLIGTSSTAVGGAYFQTGGGNATVIGDAAGGNSFFLGNGISNITGSNGNPSVAGVHSSANYYSLIASGGTDIINDFVSGLDQFSLTQSTGTPTVSSLQFYATGTNAAVFGAGNSGTIVSLSDNTKIYFYNSNVTKADFT